MPQAMEIWNAAAAEAAMDVTLLAQNPVGPMGADFGKASPIGLLVIVLLLVVILLIGVDLTRRMKRMRRRRAFADQRACPRLERGQVAGPDPPPGAGQQPA